MKSTRRHELHENVLAVELTRIADFLKRRGSHLATGVLVAALILFAFVWLRGRSRTRQDELQNQWDQALALSLQYQWGGGAAANIDIKQLIAALTELAEQDDNERIAALASVEVGFHFARQALLSTDKNQRAALTTQAGNWYGQVISNFPEQHLASAKAYYGLGKLQEGVGQLDKAAQSYAKARSFSGVEGQPVALFATAAERQLERFKTERVRMASTAPAPKPEPTTAPTTAPATAPASQPSAPPAPIPPMPIPAPTTQPAVPTP